MTPFSRTFKPIFEPKRDLKVICIGAGASGLLVTYKLQRHFENVSFQVYEKNTEVSGTWFENRYPGCACDVPSHCYTWSFEPKTDWSATYATSTEIHQYFCDFATKYNLNRFIKTQHQVSNAVWNPASAQWEVEIKDLVSGQTIQDTAHVLINAGGVLNAWRYPPIPGINDYKGQLAHSAAWPRDITLEGKNVGLIGNGSSAIQILPAIKDQVKHLKTFIRTPTWVALPLGSEYKLYTDEEKAQFVANPDHHLTTRRNIESHINSGFSIFLQGTDLQNGAREFMKKDMAEKLNNSELEQGLIPEWSVGCRRLTPGINYLESLSAPNVEVVFGDVTKITEKGAVVNGVEHEVDVLICATGFDTVSLTLIAMIGDCTDDSIQTFKPRFPIVGSNGVALSDAWKNEPKGYLGVAASKYPNYFMALGPNSPVGNGPVLIAIEAQVNYIMAFLAKFQKENYRQVAAIIKYISMLTNSARLM